MEQALMHVCKDIRLGKILIQTNHDTGEPEVTHRNQSCGSKSILCVFGPLIRKAAYTPRHELFNAKIINKEWMGSSFFA
jgi:hypothetical protein